MPALPPSGVPRRPRILLVDGDDTARAAAATALGLGGFAVEQAPGLEDALPRAGAADAVLLARDVPDSSLPDALRMIAARHPGLVLGVLGAMTDEVDEVVALELGADFCVRMGASMRVAAAQLRAALRRRDGAGPPAARPGAEPAAARPGFAEAQAGFDSGAAPVSGVTIDTERRAAVLPDGTEVPLNRAQRETLQLLIEAGGGSVTRERISEEVLGRPWSYSDRTVDNLVLSLRRRLGLDAEDGPIRAVRNIGYRLVPPRRGG